MWILLLYVILCNATLSLQGKTMPAIVGKPPPNDICHWNNPCIDLAECEPMKAPPLYWCECYQPYVEKKECHCGNLYAPCIATYCDAISNPCHNGGTCVDQWGTYVCKCTPEWQGDECQTKAHPGLIRFTPPVQLIFSLDAYTGFPADFFVVGVDKKLGTNFSAEVDFGDGCPSETVTAGVMKWSTNFVLPLRNKYNQLLMPPGPHQYGKLTHTYYLNKAKVKISFKVFNDGVLQFQNTQWLHIATNPYYCTPFVEIVDCGQTKVFVGPENRSLKKRPIWFRTDQYVLRSRVVPDCWGLSSALYYTWRLCRKEGGKEVCEETRPSSSYSRMHYTVPPFKLAYGVYEMRLKAEEKLGDQTYIKSFSNLATCSFEITAWPITAVIEGGFSISVTPNEELVVNGSRSYDPNFPGRIQHLTFEWNCAADDKFIPVCKKVQDKGNFLLLPAEHVASGVVLNFTLVVSDGKAPSTPVKQTVTAKSTQSPRLRVICHSNCAYNQFLDPERTVALRVECVRYCQGEEEEGFYKWTVLDLQQSQWLPKLFLPRTSRYFYLQPGALKKDKYYVVTVEGGTTDKSLRTVGLQMGRSTSDGHCDVTPTEGVAGVTRFKLGCHNFENYEETDLVYEFYQQNIATMSDASVMLEYDYNPLLSAYLMPGVATEKYQSKLQMRVVSGSGLMRTFDIPIKVTPPPYLVLPNVSTCTAMLSPNRYAFHDTSELIRQVILVVESANLLDKSLMAYRAVCAIEIVGSVPLSGISAVAQVAIALRRLLIHRIFAAVSARVLTAQALRNVMVEMAKLVGEQRFDGYVLYHARYSTDAMLWSVSTILDQVVVTCETQEDDYSMDYPVYSDLSPFCVQMKISNQKAMGHLLITLSNVGKMLDKINLVSDNLKNFKSPSNLTYVCFQRFLPKGVPPSIDCPHDGTAVVEMSEAMRQHFTGGLLPIGLLVAVIKGHSFWWYQMGISVSTPLLMLECPTLGAMKLTSPVDLLLTTHRTGVSTRLLTGVVKAFHDWKNPDVVELWLPLHMFEADEGEVSVVAFEELPGDVPLTVVLTMGRRPTLQDFDTAGVKVSSDKGGRKLIISREKAPEDGTLVYLGVIPTGGILQKDAKYSMTAYMVRCQHWIAETNLWSTSGCRVGHRTDGKRLHCQCYHLSLFSGRSLLVMDKKELLTKLEVTITRPVYVYAIAAIVLLLLLLLLLFLLALLLDRKDITKEIIFLSDNIPGYSYAYLIGVFTGDRPGATTTSKVGFQIIGDLYKSRHHLFQGPVKTQLRRNTDTWFILLTRLDLGELQTLRLWHDQSGDSPSWFCSRLVFVDIQRDRRWTFVVDDWLSAEKGAHLLVRAAPPSLLDAYRRRLLLWSLHPWAGVFSSYPRKQKAAVLMASVLVHMLVCMLVLFGFPRAPMRPVATIMNVGPPSSGHLLVAAVTGLVGTLVTLLLTLLFVKTRPGRYRDVTLRVGEGKVTPYDEALVDDAGSPRPFAARSVPERMETSGGQLLQSYGRAPLLFQNHFAYSEYPELETPLPLRRARTYELGGDAADPRSYWFPHAFVCVAWVVCVLVIVATTALLLLCGLSYGRDATIAWLLTTLVALGLTGLVLFPLALLVVALCGVVSHGRPDVVGARGRLTVVTDAYYPREESALKAYLLKLNLLRKTPPYRPPGPWERRDAGLRPLAVVLEALLLAFLLLVVYLLAAAARDPLQHAKGRVLGSALRQRVGDVRTSDDVETLLRGTALPLLYAKMYYNGEEPKAGSTQDPSTFMVGVTRLRQKRVRPDTCRFPKALYDETRMCNAEYGDALEGRRNLSLTWEPGEVLAADSETLKLPWQHLASTGSWPTQGDMAMYGDGGYMAPLGRVAINAFIVLDFLISHGWTDNRWRAIFWDYVTVAPDRSLVGVDALLAERSATGLVVVGVRCCSLRLPHDNDVWVEVVTVAALVLLALAAVALWLQWREARYEARRYFRRPWAVADVILTVLAIATVAMVSVCGNARSRALRSILMGERNDFASFEEACRTLALLSLFLALLTGVAMFRIWKLLSYGHRCELVVAAMRSWRTPVLGTVAVVLGVAAALALAWHVRMGAASWHFRTLWHSFLCVLGATLGFARHPLPPPPAFGVVSVAVRLLLVAVVVAVMLLHFRNCSYVFRRRRPRPSLLSALRGMRLRGGADVFKHQSPCAVVPRDSRPLHDAERRLLVAKRRLMAALTLFHDDPHRPRLAAVALNAVPMPRAAHADVFYRGFEKEHDAALVPARRLSAAKHLVERLLRDSPSSTSFAEAVAASVPWENDFLAGMGMGSVSSETQMQMAMTASSSTSSSSSLSKFLYTTNCYCNPEPLLGVHCRCSGEAFDGRDNFTDDGGVGSGVGGRPVRGGVRSIGGGGFGGGGGDSDQVGVGGGEMDGLRIVVMPSVDQEQESGAVRIRVLRGADGEVKVRIQWL